MVLVALLLSGCGSSGTATLAAGDIAIVGSQHIAKAQFDQLMAEAQANLKSQGKAFPKAGTTAYSTLKSQAVTLLVAEAQKEAAAAKLGVALANTAIDTRLTQIKKQYGRTSSRSCLPRSCSTR